MVGREELHNAHLPTGYVSIRDISRLLIGDLGAAPRRGDWEAVLGETVNRVPQWRNRRNGV